MNRRLTNHGAYWPVQLIEKTSNDAAFQTDIYNHPILQFMNIDLWFPVIQY